MQIRGNARKSRLDAASTRRDSRVARRECDNSVSRIVRRANITFADLRGLNALPPQSIATGTAGALRRIPPQSPADVSRSFIVIKRARARFVHEAFASYFGLMSCRRLVNKVPLCQSHYLSSLSVREGPASRELWKRTGSDRCLSRG